MKIKPKHLVGIAVFVISFAILLITVNDYGLTWDEPYYIAHSSRLQHWFGLLLSNTGPFSDDAVNNLVQFARYFNCHPPFYKLSGLFFKNLIGRYIYTDILHQYRVSTVFWSALLLTIIFLYLYRAYQNWLMAILGAGLFFTVPRFFAHMHLYATDAIIVSLYFLALYLFVFGEKTASAIFGGLVGGALLASKFTGVLLFPILLLAAPCFNDRKEFVKRMSFFIPASVLGFIVFDIHLWVGFRQELIFYFRSVLDRETVIPTLFFGKVYGNRLPWYHPLIMLGICIPYTVILFSILSPLYGRFRGQSKFWLFEILPFIFLLFVFALPKTPKHDGIRLFSLLWPCITLLSIRGIYAFSHLMAGIFENRLFAINRGFKVRMHWIATAVMSVALLLNIQALIKYHPYQLSYYNALIGGTAGAAKKGFSISYWYDALNQPFLKELNTAAKNNPISIYSFPNSSILKYNRALGLVGPNIRTASNMRDADYLLILNRIVNKSLSDLLEGKPIKATAVTPDNVWTIALFENIQ
jgi:hypothetical protein